MVKPVKGHQTSQLLATVLCFEMRVWTIGGGPTLHTCNVAIFFLPKFIGPASLSIDTMICEQRCYVVFSGFHAFYSLDANLSFLESPVV